MADELDNLSGDNASRLAARLCAQLKEEPDHDVVAAIAEILHGRSEALMARANELAPVPKIGDDEQEPIELDEATERRREDLESLSDQLNDIAGDAEDLADELYEIQA